MRPKNKENIIQKYIYKYYINSINIKKHKFIYKNIDI